MDYRTWRGHWWAPSAPEEKFSGTLYCYENGELKLELIGGFNLYVEEKVADGVGYRVRRDYHDIEIMHGISGSDIFTLLDNTCTHTSGPRFFDGSITEQNWSSNRALRGVQLERVDSQIFVRGHLQLERLIHWSDQSSLKIAIKGGGEGTSKRSLERESIDPITAAHQDMTVALRFLSNNIRYDDHIVANKRLAGGKEWAVLTCTPNNPVACKDFDQIQKDLQDLLTLSAYRPCGALSRSLVYETEGEAKDVEVMGRQIFRTPPSQNDTPGEMILSLSDVEFADIIPKWLNLKSRARTGCNILFGLRYIEKGYVGTRLLGVATAAESIHAALRSKTSPIPKGEYRKLKKKILEAISDERDELQDFVNKGLHNNPTYNDRMLELASIPDGDAVDLLLGDRQRWATALKRSRNDLAHANERSASGDEHSQAFHLLEVTYALLCLVLLSELGVSREVQKRAVEKNPRISFLSSQFREGTADHR
ncbi:ApeA N-terminal domain 1-containing protein [Streptomyces cyaneofuscatus]|uniref:ApeA N-terminal domain 1-containing protein n=1 Tax=Streptomyces cyaneofuscatus TaxID=66883 RepID=UPI0038244011